MPGSLAYRNRWEVAVFLGVWLLAVGHSLWRLGNGRTMAREQAMVAALLALGLPLLSLFGPEAGRLTSSIARGDWPLAGVDLGFLIAGLLCAALARRLGRPVVVAEKRRRALVEEVA
ncbi:hypothetical protein D9M70_622970 [compost metagenome]